MARISQLGIAKIASSVVVLTLLSFAPVKAQYSGPPSAQPSAPEQQAQNPVLAQVKDTLQRYGSIVQHPRYGEVWTPASGSTVPAGWSPYPACHWVYDRQQNTWNYQDPTEWGAIVHHHGRWAFDQQVGWMWIADGTYGPGHVYWKNEGASVSWAALTPDGDGVVPTDGWQTQDQQAFSQGCRAASPPPPSAGYAPPGRAPVYAGPPAPAYGTGYASRPANYPAPPVYGPRPVNVFTPPPIKIVVAPPPFTPPPVSGCKLLPNHPLCNPAQNPVFCKQNPTAPSCQKPKETTTFCKNNPNVPMCKAGGGNGGIAAGLCATNPSLPNCKKNPMAASKLPFQKFAGLQRPGLQKPVFQKPVLRPHDARPKDVRPTTQMPRPNVFRPHVQQRPQMNRPSFQPRGGFGGSSRGGFKFAGGRR